MYRPRRTVSKIKVGRITRGIYACFFVALLLACLVIPSGKAQAAGDGKSYPVDAFNGTWDYPSKAGATTHNLTMQLNADGTVYFATHVVFPPDEVFKDGQDIREEWYGTYTYDEEYGELITNASSNSLYIAMGTMTKQNAWYLNDLNMLECHVLSFNGVTGSAIDVYYRISPTPSYDDEEEEVEEEDEEESIEEETPQEPEEAETEDGETEDSENEDPTEGSEDTDAEDPAEEEETEVIQEEIPEEAPEETPEESPDQFLTDEEAEELLITIFQGDDEHLNQAKTAAAAVGMTLGGLVSALLATGTMGGAPTPPTAAEGAATAGPRTIGPGMTMDSDGDIHYKNPFTGEESVYVSNGDGTFKNVLTGIEGTVQDIRDKANLEYDNATEMAFEKERLDEWKEQQRQANSVLSKEGQEAALDRAKQEEYLKEQDRKNKIMYKRGIFDGDEKAFKKSILQQRQKEDEKFGQYAAAGEYWDAATKTAESVKKGADIAIDVMAEIEPTGAGKSIKTGYKFLAEAAGQSGQVMAGKQSLKQALGKTLVNSACEYVKDNVDMTELKCMANITGDGTAAYINARIEGKTHEQALSKANDAAKQGLANFAVDYTVGKAMDGVTGGVEIKDNKIYNGLYNNRGVDGSSISKLGRQFNKSGFTDAVVKNDRFKEGASALVSDLIKDAISDDDDD